MLILIMMLMLILVLMFVAGEAEDREEAAGEGGGVRGGQEELSENHRLAPSEFALLNGIKLFLFLLKASRNSL